MSRYKTAHSGALVSVLRWLADQETSRCTGKLDLNVPPFLNLDHDLEARKLVLSIEDRSEKKQKEMWGAS